MKRRDVLTLAGLGIASAPFLVPASDALAQQSYPSRPIKMIVPYAPGGGVDAAGRLLAQELSAHLPYPVVVENRGGAGGVLGTQAVATAAPDGQTLLLVSAVVVTSQSIMKNPPFDTMKDLRAVSLVGSSPLVLVVHPSIPATDVKSLIAYAKANPGKLNYSSAGVGTSPHLAAALLSVRTGAKMTHVPYRGSGPAMADLIAGTVQMAFSSIAAAKPHIVAGTLRGLATTGAKRFALLPSLPTVAETVPGVEIDLWTALFVPAATPDSIVASLSQAVTKALHSDAVKEGFLRTGQEATGSTPQEAQAFIKSELVKWTQVVKDAKIEPQ
jgi:tripartite-type tricarboxylate transporter receptor subunit TctC